MVFMPVGTPPAPRGRPPLHRLRATHQRGLLRRRLHPDPSRTGLRRRGLPGLRRPPRAAGRCVALRGCGARGVGGARTAAGRRLPARAVSTLRVARADPDGGGRRRHRGVLARDLRRVGPVPSLRALRRRHAGPSRRCTEPATASASSPTPTAASTRSSRTSRSSRSSPPPSRRPITAT